MKKLVYLLFISMIVNASERQAIRAIYKDDYQWITPTADAAKCGICLESDGKLKSLSCHKEHRFHPQCINAWKRERPTCPACRAEIVESAWCNCAKSFAHPSVSIGLLALGASFVKSWERLDNYCLLVQAMNSSVERVSCCAHVMLSGSCAFCLGMLVYHVRHPKDD